jgi:chromosome segregation ATPase
MKNLFASPPRNLERVGTAASEQNADPLHLAGLADSRGICTYSPRQKAEGAEAEEVTITAQEYLPTYGREVGESKHVTRTSVERYEPYQLSTQAGGHSSDPTTTTTQMGSLSPDKATLKLEVERLQTERDLLEFHANEALAKQREGFQKAACDYKAGWSEAAEAAMAQKEASIRGEYHSKFSEKEDQLSRAAQKIEAYSGTLQQTTQQLQYKEAELQQTQNAAAEI